MLYFVRTRQHSCDDLEHLVEHSNQRSLVIQYIKSDTSVGYNFIQGLFGRYVFKLTYDKTNSKLWYVTIQQTEPFSREFICYYPATYYQQTDAFPAEKAIEMLIMETTVICNHSIMGYVLQQLFRSDGTLNLSQLESIHQAQQSFPEKSQHHLIAQQWFNMTQKKYHDALIYANVLYFIWSVAMIAHLILTGIFLYLLITKCSIMYLLPCAVFSFGAVWSRCESLQVASRAKIPHLALEKAAAQQTLNAAEDFSNRL